MSIHGLRQLHHRNIPVFSLTHGYGHTHVTTPTYVYNPKSHCGIKTSFVCYTENIKVYNGGNATRTQSTSLLLHETIQYAIKTVSYTIQLQRLMFLQFSDHVISFSSVLTVNLNVLSFLPQYTDLRVEEREPKLAKGLLYIGEYESTEAQRIKEDDYKKTHVE